VASRNDPSRPCLADCVALLRGQPILGACFDIAWQVVGHDGHANVGPWTSMWTDLLLSMALAWPMVLVVAARSEVPFEGLLSSTLVYVQPHG